MEHLAASSDAVVFLGNTSGESVPLRRPRYRVSAVGRDSESNTKRARLADRIPGIRGRAPRRNALVALAYLLSAVVLVGLFGRLLGLLPLLVLFE